MVNLQVTAFHLDFSTLDIEKGEKAVLASGINFSIKPTIIQPTVKVQALVLEEKLQIKPE